MRPLATALALAAVAGCGAIPFDVSQNIDEQKVAGNPLGGILPGVLAPSFPLTIDVKSETAKRGTGPARSASLKSLSLSATRNSGNFDFLDEAHIFVSAPSLPKQEIATLKPVPKGQTTVAFTPTSVDLLPYANAGATIDSTASGSQPKMDFYFDGALTITVNF